MTTSIETPRPDTVCAQNGGEARAWVKPHFTSEVLDNGYRLKVILPGTRKGDLKLSLEDDVLTLEARRTDQVPDGWKRLTRELSSADYRLELRLHVPVNAAEITASLSDGVLDLMLPLSEAAKPRVIEVQ